MEIQKPVSNEVETQKKRPVLFIFSIVLLIGLVAFALYLSFTKSAIQDQQKQLDEQIAQLNSQIAVLKSQNVEGQQFAKQWLEQLEKDEIRWSKVIKTVQDILPVDPVSQKARVQFLSYSGSAGGKLTMNAQTVAGSIDPYADVATLLNIFNNSSFFKDGYVPSLSHSVGQTGQDILSFSFNVKYEEQLPDVQTSLSNVTSVVPSTAGTSQQSSSDVSGSVKVPRNAQ